MKTTVNNCDFHRAFNGIKPENFSYDGLNALFDYLTEYEDSSDNELELDVIALCCEYTEYESIEEYNDIYGTEYENTEKIEERTTVIYIDDPPGRNTSEYEGRFIIQNY